MGGWQRQLSGQYPTDLPAWKKLNVHWRERMGERTLSDLFRRDPGRAERFWLRAGALTLDYSKNIINAETHRLLVQLARQADVEPTRDAMFAGDHINSTEDRAVLHVALRSKPSDRYKDGKQNCTRDVHRVLDAMGRFVRAIHAGRITGSRRSHFTDVVNIGIGGSDLGIVMTLRALEHHRGHRPRVHCVSNVDGTQLADLTRELNPASTLFVICSKTFTTEETMTNARVARRWVVRRLGKNAVRKHFAAASTNHAAMDAFGIDPDFRFGFWDWVGGRYSLWSAVGLSIALGIGMRNFHDLLAGGRAMDQHFRKAPLERNMPVTLALLSVWYNNFFGAETQAILPYDNRLDRFPAFLQQMQMESNGKSVRVDGRPVRTETGMIIWGEAGNNAQHSFYQLLHQGTRLVPVDFLLPVRSSGASQKQQDLAIANCLAQGQALMEGRSEQVILAGSASGNIDPGLQASASHQVHLGNRPSNTLVFKALDPYTLGELIALYEHKVFVEGVILGVNSFDQWGVQLGKQVALALKPAVGNVKSAASENHSTARLLGLVARLRP